MWVAGQWPVLIMFGILTVSLIRILTIPAPASQARKYWAPVIVTGPHILATIIKFRTPVNHGPWLWRGLTNSQILLNIERQWITGHAELTDYTIKYWAAGVIRDCQHSQPGLVSRRYLLPWHHRDMSRRYLWQWHHHMEDMAAGMSWERSSEW